MNFGTCVDWNRSRITFLPIADELEMGDLTVDRPTYCLQLHIYGQAEKHL